MKKLLKNFSIFAFVIISIVACSNNKYDKKTIEAMTIEDINTAEQEKEENFRKKIVDDIKSALLEKLNEHEVEISNLKKSDKTQSSKIKNLEKEIATIKKMLIDRDKEIEKRLSALEKGKTEKKDEPVIIDIDAFIKTEIEDDINQRQDSHSYQPKPSNVPVATKKISSNATIYPIFLDSGNGTANTLDLRKSCAYKVEKKGHKYFVAKNADPVISFSLNEFSFNASKAEIEKKIMNSLDDFSKQYGKSAAAFVFTNTSKGLSDEVFIRNFFDVIEKNIPHAKLIFPNYGNFNNAKKIAKEKNLDLIIADNLIEEASDYEYVLEKCLNIANQKGKAVVLINSSSNTVSAFNDFVDLNNIKTQGIIYY